MDAWIAMMQEWLDDTYGGRFGYTPTPGDGRTGWPTMYSMTRAMQLELGISQPSDAFGPGTRNEYQAQIGSVSAATAQSHPNIIGILRMALWCKGYYSGYLEPDYPQFLNYTDDVENAIRQIRIDLGIDEGEAPLSKSWQVCCQWTRTHCCLAATSQCEASSNGSMGDTIPGETFHWCHVTASTRGRCRRDYCLRCNTK